MAKYLDLEGTKHLIDLIKDNYTKFPTGGHLRLLLAWKADGEAEWVDIVNMFDGMELLLAYGVEWDTTVQDPHLTRIGNMSLHRTLPILSLLKGCIAQADKVIYWLDDNDWKWRKDPIIKTMTVSGDTIVDDVFGTKLYEGAWVRVDGSEFLITSIDTSSKTATLSGSATTGSLSVELGAVLNGYDGTVRVYCPNFYIKSESDGNKRRVWISTVKIDSTYTHQPAILIDAYRSTVLNAVPTDMGYLSTLKASSAISVVNTSTYCRGGGNRSGNDSYLANDIFKTDLGKPRTSLSRSTMRTYSRNAGNHMMSYDQYKNIFYWLYVIEYANFNCLEAFNSALTDDGFHQGGMGTGVTYINSTKWSLYNGYYPLTPCGYCNEFGNGTGVKSLVIPAQGDYAANTFNVPRWRGFDNPFGDVWTNLDGIIIDPNADNHPNNMNYVYTCNDPDKYTDSITSDYEKVGEEIHLDGWTKEWNLGEAAHIFPLSMGGSDTKNKCDYHWTGSKDTTLRTLLVGGSAATGAYAGLGFFNSSNGVSNSSSPVGFRSVSGFLSFS